MKSELRLLVVGNGYLGSYLVEYLNTHCDWRVVVASKNGISPCFEADLGSLQSIENLKQQLPFSPDWIVHCASSSRGGPDAYENVFVKGTQHLNQVFPGAIKLLTSSTSVYPQIDGKVVTEQSETDPDRQTGKYLRIAEEEILSANGLVLRLAGIYGPERSVHLKKMRAGTATIESGEVSRWLNQIHRDDAAQAIIHLINTYQSGKGEVYNVCDDEPISQRDCYQQLATILAKPVPEESVPDLNRKRAWTHKQVSNQKLKQTGWEPQFPSFIEAVVSDSRL